MEKGQEEEVAVSPWCHWAGGRKELLLFIFQIFSNINKNEGGERLKSHVVVGLSLRSLGSEEQAGEACELRAAVGG